MGNPFLTSLTPNLLLTALVAAAFSYLVIVRILPPLLSLAIVLFKFTLPTIYFAWFYTGQWNIIDDITYLERAIQLIESGYSPWMILTPEGIQILMTTADSQMFLYYWWNMVAMTLFGKHYYAPVFLNVTLTFVTGVVFAEILRNLEFQYSYRKWAVVFGLLQWNLVAWSSFLNVKDILVIFLTMVGIFGLLKAFDYSDNNSAIPISLVCLTTSFLGFWWLRYYIPFLMISAAIGWIVLHKSKPIFYVSAVSLVFPAVVVFRKSLWALDWIEPGLYAYGLIRFILTPRPWGTTVNYSFLVIPAFIHWIVLVPASVGALYLFRTSKKSRFILFYSFIVLSFYAIVPELQGPRHRLQLSVIWGWWVFHGGWVIKQRVVFRY